MTVNIMSFRKKNRDNNGYTLVEMLVCCVLIIMVTGIIELVIVGGYSAFNNTFSDNKKKEFCNDIADRIKYELRYIDHVELDLNNSLNGYTLFGEDKSIQVINVDNIPDSIGYIALKSGETYSPIINSREYHIGNEDFKVSLDLTCDMDESLLKSINITVYMYDMQGKLVDSSTIDMIPIQQVRGDTYAKS